MLNVSTLITSYETVGDHTEFIIQISCSGVVWLISRRFSDFDQLNSHIKQRFGSAIRAELPEKQWFGRFDPNFLSKRQSRLQEYLDSILQVAGIFEDRVLQHFLEMEKNVDLCGENALYSISSGNGNDNGRMSQEAEAQMDAARMATIVDNASHAFIDVSQVGFEPLEAEDELQRRNEILNSCQSFTLNGINMSEVAGMQVPKSSNSDQEAIRLLSEDTPVVHYNKLMTSIAEKVKVIVDEELHTYHAPSTALIADLSSESLPETAVH